MGGRREGNRQQYQKSLNDLCLGTKTREAGELCAGDTCIRDDQKIKSGTQVELGCHHAEANAICNAARYGQSTKGCWLVVTRAPCLNCAKYIHHSGITQVFSPKGEDSTGIDYLIENGIKVKDWV